MGKGTSIVHISPKALHGDTKKTSNAVRLFVPSGTKNCKQQKIDEMSNKTKAFAIKGYEMNSIATSRRNRTKRKGCKMAPI